MLTDKTMARLAEDCGWTALTIHNPPLGPAIDYRDNNGNLMIDATGQLTDAGCWQVQKRFFADAEGTRTQWQFRLFETWYEDNLLVGYKEVGSGKSDTPEYALHAALNDMYREASTDEQ